MQSGNLSGLDRLLNWLDDLREEHPRRKRQLLDRLGKALQRTAAEQAAASGMKNGGGRVPGWQKYHLGSRLGYTAVRPVGGKEGAETGPNGPGAVTNYTENGHAIRRPSAVRRGGYRYRPRIKVAAVRGYHYDARSERSALAACEAESRAWCEEMGREMGGPA